MNTTNDRIIIGIDPGTNVMGYGVLRIVGNTPELMTLGVIQLNKFEKRYLISRFISDIYPSSLPCPIMLRDTAGKKIG